MNFLKTKINTKKLFTVIVTLLILWAVLSFSSIVPKIYYFISGCEFSYEKGTDATKNNWINNIEWQGSDLIINGGYEYFGTGVKLSPTFIHGSYDIKEDKIFLFVRKNNFQFKIIKKAHALLWSKKINFRFVIKNLSKKNYEIVLNNTESWRIYPNGNKKLLRYESCGNYNSDCWERLAKELNNIRLCLNLKDQILVESCFEHSINKKEDIKGCNDNMLCLQMSAKKLKDVKICDKIQNLYEKDICIKKVAISLNNKNMCYQINDHSVQYKCFMNTYW